MEIKTKTESIVTEVQITMSPEEAQDLFAIVEGLTVTPKLQKMVLSERYSYRKIEPATGDVNKTLMSLWMSLDDVCEKEIKYGREQ